MYGLCFMTSNKYLDMILEKLLKYYLTEIHYLMWHTG